VSLCWLLGHRWEHVSGGYNEQVGHWKVDQCFRKGLFGIRCWKERGGFSVIVTPPA
jgi:hypothetical protein